MIKRLIWTIWTPMSSVLKKADKLNLSLSLRNCWSDWSEMKMRWVNMILGRLYDLALWPHPWPWPWSWNFKVRVWNSFISGFGRLIDFQLWAQQNKHDGSGLDKIAKPCHAMFCCLFLVVGGHLDGGHGNPAGGVKPHGAVTVALTTLSSSSPQAAGPALTLQAPASIQSSGVSTALILQAPASIPGFIRVQKIVRKIFFSSSGKSQGIVKKSQGVFAF